MVADEGSCLIKQLDDDFFFLPLLGVCFGQTEWQLG